MNSASPVSQSMPRSLVLLLGLAVGVIVANLYYTQPLISLISESLGLAPASSGFIVTLTQIGYGLGVLFLIPLGDLVENKKLVLILMIVALFGLLGLALSESIYPYFAAALLTGIGASAAQVLIPYGAHLSPEHLRGRTVGSLMSGLMLGIMLSRPIASFLTDLFSWHAVFFLSAGLMLLIGLLLVKYLPQRQPPQTNLTYRRLLTSMGNILAGTPVLRRRGIYQACMFASFSVFWTTTPMLLSGPEYNLSQTAIALFALAGVAGAVIAPFAGRLADSGYTRIGTICALLIGALSFGLTHLFSTSTILSLMFLITAAIVLDACVTVNLVLGQREIFSLPSELRSRLNGLYIAIIFVGGALGSFLGAWAYADGGWLLASLVGAAFPLVALVYFATESRVRKALGAA